MKEFTAKQVDEKDTSILGYAQSAGEKTWSVISSLSLSELEENTRPRENGLDDGQKNHPPAGATEMARTEQRILFEAERFLGKARDFANKNLTDIRRKMAALAENGGDNFFAVTREPQKEFTKHWVTVDPELTDLRVEERTALRDLNRFKADHGLQRSAVYPDSHVKHLALVCFFLLCECLANTYFFAANSDLGYLGGFFQALVVSIANVGLSYLCGWLALRELNHHRPLRKAVGALCLGLYGTSITVFHLLVAHYRDLLTLDPENAIRMTLPRFSEGPFSFDTLESIIVIAIGVIISVLALMKGYTHDDRYPGYGEVDRLHKVKAKAYRDKEMAARGRMIGLVDGAEEKVNQRLAQEEARVAEMRDLLDGAKSVVAHIDNIDQQVAKVAHTAVAIYREANKSVRTEALPAYFATLPVLQNRLDKGVDILVVANLEQTVAKAQADLEQVRAKAGHALAALFAESEKIGQTIEALADKVDRKAKEQLVQA